jgi:predicted transcriptional regulator
MNGLVKGKKVHIEKGQIMHTITLKSDDTFYNTLEGMAKSLHTTKSNLIRKAVTYLLER